MAATDTLTDKAMKKALKDASTAGKPKRASDGGGLYFEARLAAAGLPGPGTFEHTAREWHEYSKAQWSSRHAVKVLALLEMICCRSSARGHWPTLRRLSCCSRLADRSAWRG